MASLYELTSEYAAWTEILMDADPEVAETAMTALPELEAAIDGKADAYAKLIKNLQANADAYGKEAERLDKLKKTCENGVERLKKAMLEGMQTAGKDKIRTTIGTWSVKKNPASCEVVDPKLVPEQYKEAQEPKVLKGEILKWFKSTGEIVPGVTIVDNKQSISFR